MVPLAFMIAIWYTKIRFLLGLEKGVVNYGSVLPGSWFFALPFNTLPVMILFHVAGIEIT